MAYAVEHLHTGSVIAAVTGPTPTLADELVVEDSAGRVRRYRVLTVEHRISAGCESHPVAIVEDADG